MDLNSDRHETNDDEVEWEIQIGLTIEAEESAMEAESKIGEDIANEWERRIASAIEAAHEWKMVDDEVEWEIQIGLTIEAEESAMEAESKIGEDIANEWERRIASAIEAAHEWKIVDIEAKWGESSILNENTQLSRHDNELEMGQGMMMTAKLDAFHSDTNSKELSAEKAHSVESSILNEIEPSSSHETEVAMRREVGLLTNRYKRKRKEYRQMQLQLATKKLRRLSRADQIVSLGHAMECATKYARYRTRNESAELKMLQKDRLFAEMSHDQYFGQNIFPEELSLRMRSIEHEQ